MKIFRVDSKKCEACGTCVEKCPRNAIRIVGIWFHKHAKITKKTCLECGTCVRNCSNNAIVYY